MSDSHSISFRVYLNILLVLVFLTFVTVGAAQVDFGSLNAFIALFIASLKGALVLLYFMHLKYEDKLYWVVFGSGVFFVLLLYFLTEIDHLTRVQEINTL